MKTQRRKQRRICTKPVKKISSVFQKNSSPTKYDKLMKIIMMRKSKMIGSPCKNHKNYPTTFINPSNANPSSKLQQTKLR